MKEQGVRGGGGGYLVGLVFYPRGHLDSQQLK